MNCSKSLFVMLVVIAVAVLVMVTAAYAQAQGGSADGCGDGVCMNVMCLSLDCGGAESYENCPQDCGSEANCYNGTKDLGEEGIDCGGPCARYNVEDICDRIDNDRDCQVDENCKGSSRGGGISQPVEPIPSCNDGVQNQDEVGADCGGVCATNAAEVCDGKDNNNDCMIDVVPGTVRNACTVVDESSEPAIDESELIETPAQLVSSTQPEAESYPATPAESLPSLPVAGGTEISDVSSLTDEQLDAFIEQNLGAEFIKQMRRLAEDKGIYVPKGESDAQFGRKYVRYYFKHQSELVAKFEGKESTEEDFVDVLKQFSEEAYPKLVEQKQQSQSFFSKVTGFFKRLFR